MLCIGQLQLKCTMVEIKLFFISEMDFLPFFLKVCQILI